MILKGDISTFHPSNLLLFFADFEREGLLTIEKGDGLLTISLRGSQVINAHSQISDDKLLNAIYLRRLVNKKQLLKIQEMKKVTGLPVALIIEKLPIISLTDIQQEIKNGIYEVLFQLFRMEQGPFHLTDIAVEEIAGVEPLDCKKTALEMSRWVDEWQEIERTLSSLERIVSTCPPQPDHSGNTVSMNEKLVLNLAKNPKSIGQIITTAPITSYMALKTVNQMLAKGRLTFSGDKPVLPKKHTTTASERQFNSFRNSFRKIIQSSDRQTQIAKFITYCRDNFDYTVVLATYEASVRNCIIFSKTESGATSRKDMPDLTFQINLDPIFENVLNSGHSFFGNFFESDILKQIIQQEPAGGLCAVIRLKKEKDRGVLVYAALKNEARQMRLFHFLELLAWIINPPQDEVAAPRSLPSTNKLEPAPGTLGKGGASTSTDQKLHQLIETIDELPPLPHVVTQVMELLADPDYDISKLAELLTNDQVLVAKLLKISNSALYARGRPVSNIKGALTRLGTKTIKSIVITASLKSFFKDDNSQIGKWNRDLWAHSKRCGLAARRIAEFSGYKDPEEAFVGGVLHDIGKLVIFLKYPDIYATIIDDLQLSSSKEFEIERKKLGFDHTDIGSLLMHQWGMPKPLLNCVRYHHNHLDAKDSSELVKLITFGNQISRLYEILVDAKPIIMTTDPVTGEIKKRAPANAPHERSNPSEENSQAADHQLKTEIIDKTGKIAEKLFIPLENEEALYEIIVSDFSHLEIFD